MSRPPAAREAVLDAFETLINADGERTATLEATARAAGVSKGGLLYHFGSRQALIAGLIERLHHQIDGDLERMRAAPDGAVSYFIRSSVEVETPLDRTFVAAIRLAQAGDRDAARAIDEVRDRWLDELRRTVPDPTLSLAIMFVSDGLYSTAALRAETAQAGGTATVDTAGMDALVAMFERMAGLTPR